MLATDIQDLGDDKEAYRLNFVLRNNRDRDDFQRLVDLAETEINKAVGVVLWRDGRIKTVSVKIGELEGVRSIWFTGTKDGAVNENLYRVPFAGGEVTRLIDTFRIAAEESVRMTGEVMPLDISARARGYSGMWKRVPIGPCSFIAPSPRARSR